MPTADSGSPIAAEHYADLLDLAAVVVAVALVFLVLIGWTGVPRVLLTLLFTFFVPGRAIVSNWSQMAEWANLAMSIATSLGLLVLLALITLWLRSWHPESLFTAEALLSTVGLGIGYARRRRSYRD